MAGQGELLFSCGADTGWPCRPLTMKAKWRVCQGCRGAIREAKQQRNLEKVKSLSLHSALNWQLVHGCGNQIRFRLDATVQQQAPEKSENPNPKPHVYDNCGARPRGCCNPVQTPTHPCTQDPERAPEGHRSELVQVHAGVCGSEAIRSGLRTHASMRLWHVPCMRLYGEQTLCSHVP